MNRKYNLKLDLQFRCNNSIMKFNQFDNNTSDFFIKISNGGKSFDVEKAIVVLATIKPSGKVSSQFIEVKNDVIYADLKPSMKDEIGTYTAQAMLILEDERVVTDSISYKVEEDKIFSLLNDNVETTEEFTLLTDMLSRLSTIETNEEQRVINEAERILSEENRKIEEAKRVEAELIRQHEEADRTKYDAIRESNENIRKQNESIRLANETNRIDEEAKRVEEENKRKLAEEERNANYNFMTEDEDRRRSEANAHKEAEKLRAQAEITRVNEEAKRRTTEQARVSAENTRVNNENTRESNEVARQNNENQRIEAETQRKNRYNSFISDAEANANNFENYTNTAKAKEEERKANELDRKSQENRRVSNEVERISNENTRKANEVVREKNEASRQDVFENKVDEFDEKIVELNTTKDNFVSSINTKVDNKISEIEVAKSDMTNTVTNKIDEVENRFNALTSKQQQDAEVVDARDGETSLKARLDRDIEKANKELDKIKKLEESTVSTVETGSDFTTVEATSNGYFEDVKLEGRTLVNLCAESGTKSNYYINSFKLNNIDENKEYTLIYTLTNVVKGDYTGVFSVEVTDKANNGYIYAPFENGTFIYKIKPRVGKDVYCVYFWTSSLNQGQSYEIKDVMLLEGDHTQNPPSYFEGLKSAGQSASEDGADEIVVSSINENLFDVNQHIPYGWSNGNMLSSSNYRSYWIKCKPNTTYFIESDRSGNRFGVCCSNIIKFGGEEFSVTKGTVFGSSDDTDKIVSTLFTTDNTAKYLFVYTINNGVFPTPKIMISKSDIQINYIEPNRDKKRLLYYNEETQEWEKPVLREGDSIEKHADGKYYYHQRSAEVVLNGSENWNNDKNSSTISPATYRQSIQFNAIDIPSASFNTKTSPNIISDLLPTVTFGDVYSYNRIGISISGTGSVGTHIIINNNFTDVTELKQWLQANNLTVVYQLAEEKVYECTNIDLITYSGETNFIVESGVLSPKTTLKVHSNISNVVSLLQKKVSLLESNMTKYMITQNRLMLASRYNADTVSFKVDVASFSDTFEYDNDLYELILNNILVGKDNYNREYIENLIIFYWMDFVISDEMYSTLFEIIEEQHNPKIEEETPLI